MRWPGGGVAENKHVLTNYYPTASPHIFAWLTHSPPDAPVCFVLIIFPNLSIFEKHSFGVSEATSLIVNASACNAKNGTTCHTPAAFEHRRQCCVRCTFLFTCLCECAGVGWGKKLNTQQMAILWLSLQWNADQQTRWNIFCSEPRWL